MNVATRKERKPEMREIQLLTAIGAWAGITIENARLHRQARRVAILEERERIGMDLHDGIVQSIYSVGLALDFARLALDEDPKLARQKIEQAIEGLKSDPHSGKEPKLELSGFRSLATRRYRVIYRVREPDRVVEIHYFGRRADVSRRGRRPAP